MSYVNNAVLCLSALLLGYLVVVEILKILKERAIIMRCGIIIETNNIRLQRWEKLEPFLTYRSYCGYARALILQMIQAAKILARYAPDNLKIKKCLATLQAQLDELPPRGPSENGPFHYFTFYSDVLHP